MLRECGRQGVRPRLAIPSEGGLVQACGVPEGGSGAELGGKRVAVEKEDPGVIPVSWDRISAEIDPLGTEISSGKALARISAEIGLSSAEIFLWEGKRGTREEGE